MLTIESMYELAHRAARRVPTHPACDHDDLVQCAVIGMIESGVSDPVLATVVARRRIIDEVRRHWGRSKQGQPAGQTNPRRPLHLFSPLPRGGNRCLADIIPDEDCISRVVERVDASREARQLLRALDRRRRRMLMLYAGEGQSTEEIARRYGVTRARVSQLVAEARERARRVHAARGATIQPVERNTRARPGSRDWLEATLAEKRAFGEFRQLQRAGLRRQEALAALPEGQRALVSEYQRKSQRRVRARAAEQRANVSLDRTRAANVSADRSALRLRIA